MPYQTSHCLANRTLVYFNQTPRAKGISITVDSILKGKYNLHRLVWPEHWLPRFGFGSDIPFPCWNEAFSLLDLPRIQKAALFGAACAFPCLPDTIYLG
jgi:hypothetical protein